MCQMLEERLQKKQQQQEKKKAPRRSTHNGILVVTFRVALSSSCGTIPANGTTVNISQSYLVATKLAGPESSFPGDKPASCKQAKRGASASKAQVAPAETANHFRLALAEKLSFDWSKGQRLLGPTQSYFILIFHFKRAKVNLSASPWVVRSQTTVLPVIDGLQGKTVLPVQ